MTQLWIYGFAPFRHYRKNITQELLALLPPRQGLKTEILPVRFEKELFLSPLETVQPRYILGLGQCPRGHLLRLERCAYNWMRDRSQGIDQVIDSNLPDKSTLSWQLPLRSDTRFSYDAGRYVCNFSMFQLAWAAQNREIPFAFVHIPKDYSLKRGLNWLESVLQEAGI